MTKMIHEEDTSRNYLLAKSLPPGKWLMEGAGRSPNPERLQEYISSSFSHAFEIVPEESVGLVLMKPRTGEEEICRGHYVAICGSSENRLAKIDVTLKKAVSE